MDIIRKDLKTVIFGILKPGETFEHDGRHYMKTAEIVTSPSYHTAEYFNAHSLGSGRSVFLPLGEPVLQTNGKFVIENS